MYQNCFIGLNNCSRYNCTKSAIYWIVLNCRPLVFEAIALTTDPLHLYLDNFKYFIFLAINSLMWDLKKINKIKTNWIIVKNSWLLLQTFPRERFRCPTENKKCETIRDWERPKTMMIIHSLACCQCDRMFD